jgi:hypothetical protein
MSKKTWDVVMRPTRAINKIVLDRISIIMSCMTVSSSLLFEGEINFSRFENALTIVSRDCPWLLCSLNVSGEEVYLSPRKSEEGETDYPYPGHMMCEFTQIAEEFNRSAHTADLLPVKVHEKMLRADLAMVSVQDLPICSWRLIQFNSHFVVSYRLNHAFYDQSSIVYLLTYLSHAYTLSDSPLTMAKPVFKPRSNIVPPDFPAFASLEEFDSAAPKGYTSAPFSGGTFGPPKTLTLIINKEKVSELRGFSVFKHISSNDIVHAALLQIVSRFNCAKARAAAGGDGMEEGIPQQQEQSCRVLFARNMRGPLGLGAEIVGDYVRLQCLQVPSVAAMDLMELSAASRASLSEDLGDQYVRECKWFLEYKDRRGPALCGSPDFMTDECAAVVTNWSSFPYQDILFDRSAPIELMLSPTPFTSSQALFVVIAWRGQGAARDLVVVVNSLHEGVIAATREYCEDSGLFIVES